MAKLTLTEALARIAVLEDQIHRAEIITLDRIDVAVGEALDTARADMDEDTLLDMVQQRIRNGGISAYVASCYLLEYIEIDSSWLYSECERRDITTYDDDEIKNLIGEGVAESFVVRCAVDLIGARNDSDRDHYTRELRNELQREHGLN
jgi:hypothetical protein